MQTMTHFFETAPFGTFSPSPFMKRLLAFSKKREHSWLEKRLAFAARRLGLALLKTPVDTIVFDKRMRLYPFRNVCEKRLLFTPQYFDARERDFLEKHLPKDAVFIDIGANIGGYALFVASITDESSTIYAVEPQPIIHERLVYNIEINEAHNIHAHRIAVADKDGEVTLFLDETNQGEASMKLVGFGARGGQSTTVEAKALLTLVSDQNIQRIDGLKIDVEGAEDIILERFFCDADEVLHPNIIVLENGEQSWQTNCVALLKSYDYVEVERTRLNIILQKQVL
jgi:FkbM family methyltransferase